MCSFSKSNEAIPSQFFAQAQTFDRGVTDGSTVCLIHLNRENVGSAEFLTFRLIDWLTGMFFYSIPVQPCSSQIWCRQTGRGRVPDNVRQTFKHRFVPKLIGIVSLSILIVYGRVNHRTQRRFVLAAELSETSKQGKTKSLLTLL